MNNQLYIPKRIKVGYRERDDTYSKKLAYIIYYDDKGVLRKEKSWEGWRDKKIAPEEYDNTPQSGFILNKDIKRYNFSHFSSHRTMIRVWDPRGIEFEVTTENLIGILMHSNCSKRELIDSKFVYAWAGTELVLLPTVTEEYQNSVEYTSLQGKKIGAKDLVPGCSYKTKKQEDTVYVGRFNWYTWKGIYSGRSKRTHKKYYIFLEDYKYSDSGKKLMTRSNLDFLAAKNSDEIVANYASIVEDFQKDIHSSEIDRWETKPVSFDSKTTKTTWGESLDKPTYFQIVGNVITQHDIRRETRYFPTEKEQRFSGYDMESDYSLLTDTNEIIYSRNRIGGYSYYNHTPRYQLADLEKQEFCDLYCCLKNGHKIKVDSLSMFG
jgi:hypothetical protein